MEGYLIIVFFLVLLVIGVPVAFALGLSVVFHILVSGDISMLVVAQRISSTLDSFPLIAVPLFLMAGLLMNEVGFTYRIFNVANVIIGRVSGGLGHVNVLASMIFAGMSGSAIADAGGLGTVEIKAMSDAGYRKGFSAAITSASAIIGPIIPPSIIMVIYGVIAEVSIRRLFIGGIIPGLMMAFSLMAVIYYRSKSGKEICPTPRKSTFSEKIRAAKEGIFPLMAPVIIIGGIISGVFTPTEASAVAVLYTIVVGLFYRTLTFSKLVIAFKQTLIIMASVLFIVAAAGLFSWIIAIDQIPQKIVHFMVTKLPNKIVMLLFLNFVLIIMGMFLSGLASLILIAPVLIPLADQLQLDLVHLGIFVIINGEIGLNTPPVGGALFTLVKVANISIEDLVKALIPFYFPLVVVLLLVTYFPDLVLFLPNLIFK